jgi:hypothetical protein
LGGAGAGAPGGGPDWANAIETPNSAADPASAKAGTRDHMSVSLIVQGQCALRLRSQQPV